MLQCLNCFPLLAVCAQRDLPWPHRPLSDPGRVEGEVVDSKLNGVSPVPVNQLSKSASLHKYVC
jgi:hypothetical protein